MTSMANEVRNNVYVVASNWFVNRCPLATRVPRVPIGSTTFSVVGRARPGEVPVGYTQWCETWTHPVKAGQPIDKSSHGDHGPRSPFDGSKMDGLQNLVDDMEYTSFYGRGYSPATLGRPRQKGLRNILEINRTVNPVNGNAYKPTDLIRDTLKVCRDGGGEPDVLLVSSNFMTAFVVWGQALQRVDAGVSVFGTPIDLFEAPFLGGVSIIEAPLLKPFTAVCLTSSEIRMRMKRNEFWNPRGVRGDAHEGEWIAEGAIEADVPTHHAWVEGVTAFSAV